MLIKHDVLRLRSKLIDDIRVPCVANQESSLTAIGGDARLADTELEMTCAVSGVGVSQIRQISPEAHLQVNNFDPRLACSGNHITYRPDGLLDRRNVDSCAVLANDTELVATLGAARTKEAVDRAVRDVASKRLDRLLRNRESGAYVPAIKFAREHLRTGDQEEALKWLTLACEERNVYSLLIATDPFYDPLRADRRFAKLLRRMKLDG